MSNNNTPNTETGSLITQVGDGSTDGQKVGVSGGKVGFYGTTPAAQAAATALTAIATTTLSEAKTGSGDLLPVPSRRLGEPGSINLSLTLAS